MRSKCVLARSGCCRTCCAQPSPRRSPTWSRCQPTPHIHDTPPQPPGPHQVGRYGTWRSRRARSRRTAIPKRHGSRRHSHWHRPIFSGQVVRLVRNCSQRPAPRLCHAAPQRLSIGSAHSFWYTACHQPRRPSGQVRGRGCSHGGVPSGCFRHYPTATTEPPAGVQPGPRRAPAAVAAIMCVAVTQQDGAVCRGSGSLWRRAATDNLHF